MDRMRECGTRSAPSYHSHCIRYLGPRLSSHETKLFYFSSYCPEDFFSHSLAYVTNLFPEVGEQLTNTIGALAAKKSDYFGAFEQCEFVGHECQANHVVSRPDLKILCANRTIYLENKLDSPLNLEQMQRHATLTCRNPQCSLVFVSNIQHISPLLRTLAGYIHPTDRDHYVWTDFLAAFTPPDARHSLPGKILGDFADALKANGMVGRNIKGAGGSLYTFNSEAARMALQGLWHLLKDVGFRVAKLPQHETTIRAYPVKYRQYPLLNPRFAPTASWLDKAWDTECLEGAVISQGRHETFDQQLRRFDATPDCVFLPDDFATKQGLRYHGIILPLHFTGAGATSDIDFTALRAATIPHTSVLHSAGRALMTARSGSARTAPPTQTETIRSWTTARSRRYWALPRGTWRTSYRPPSTSI